MKKYKILKDDRIFYPDKILYRIKALKNFNDVKKGDIGGYIEDYKNLSQEGNAWIFDNAKVFDDAFIKENAKVSGNASVFGTALVEGNAEISGSAKIFNDPYVGGNVKIRDNSKVYGNSKVYDNAVICGNAEVFDYAVVCGDAEISNDAKVFRRSSVNGNAKVKGNAKVRGNAKVYGSAVLKFGVMTKDIKEDLKQLIACSLNVYPVKGKYILYKRVNKIDDGVYRSLYDSDFIYRKGKIAEVKDYDPNFNVSCGRGLHVSTPFYWSGGDTLIAVEVKLKDVITCMQGKLRVKKLKVIGEV